MPTPEHEPGFLLPHEDPERYRDLLAGLIDAHQPRDTHESMLVQELADAYWNWQRARANDREFWDYIGGHYKHGNAGIAEAMAQEKETRFRTHLRHMALCERQYYRALAAVERMRRDRGLGRPLPAAASGEIALAAAAEQQPAGPKSGQPAACAILSFHDHPRRAPSPSPSRAAGSFLIQEINKRNPSPPRTTAGFSIFKTCNSISQNSMASSQQSYRTLKRAAS